MTYCLRAIPLPLRFSIIASATSITSSRVSVCSFDENTILTVIDFPDSSVYVSATKTRFISGQFCAAIASRIGANLSLTNERSISISGYFDGSSYLMLALESFAKSSTSISANTIFAFLSIFFET